MHRLRFLLVMFLCFVCVTGCTTAPTLSDREANIYRQLHKKFSRMKSYGATVKLTVKGNKTENIYTITQKVKSPEQAVVTIKEPASLAGVTTVFSGDSVSVSAFEDELPLTVPAQDSLQDIFVNHFFSLYYQSEETALSVSATEENRGTILLETAMTPKSTERYKITMLCDTKTLEPKTITVYDVGGNIRMVAEFLEFSYNPSFDSSLFVIQ
ncbi:MAG: hypothetical protein IJF61_00030 [Clostridia bacterium]|nr:hypothetical protein [Clostridia bacterium]